MCRLILFQFKIKSTRSLQRFSDVNKHVFRLDDVVVVNNKKHQIGSDRMHSIEKETVCSSAIDGGFQLDTFDDVIKYNTGKSLLCFLKIGGNHEVQLLQLLPVYY